MKIEKNKVYHLPTKKHEEDFLKQADKLGLMWAISKDVRSHWEMYGEDFVIYTKYEVLRYGSMSFYATHPRTYLECGDVIEWQIGFTKADMQIGQGFKVRDGRRFCWNETASEKYHNNLKWKSSYFQDETISPNDIVEVYPMQITPIWKRPEPKYRMKTELTKEQAEKLGLEFCEVIE